MPFQPLDFVPKSLKVPMASVSYKRNETKRGRTKKPNLIVGIPSALVPQFKPVKDALFDIHIGTGADAGRARIMRSEKGVGRRLLKTTYVFRFGFVPLLGDSAAEREHVACRGIDKGTIEIDLPAWFKPD